MDTNIKILIVDDVKTMRKIVRQTLSQIGYLNVKEAENGIEALQIFKNDNFDLIISDWHMPEMDGLELLKTIRNTEELKDTPFIIVSAEALKENVKTAIEAGVDNYIVKPFSAQTLKKKIEETFAKYKTRQLNEH
jgi:two-component system chemotaxis response regulator CheY